MSAIGDFIGDQILGMKWLNELIRRGLSALGLDISTRIGGSVQFFLYDVIKITVLLCFLILLISYIQSYFPPERSKKLLGRFRGIWANIIAALLGTVTPFCSCSSIDQEAMAGYDVIFVGFPIWWYDLPMPVWSFLEEYDLSGKTIIPFFTHNGSSSGASSISTIEELCPDSTALSDSYFTYAGDDVAEAESAVDEWLDELGYTN